MPPGAERDIQVLHDGAPPNSDRGKSTRNGSVDVVCRSLPNPGSGQSPQFRSKVCPKVVEDGLTPPGDIEGKELIHTACKSTMLMNSCRDLRRWNLTEAREGNIELILARRKCVAKAVSKSMDAIALLGNFKEGGGEGNPKRNPKAQQGGTPKPQRNAKTKIS